MKTVPDSWSLVNLGGVLSKLESGKRMKGGALKVGGIFSIGGEHIKYSGNVDWNGNPKYISEDFYRNMKKGKVKNLDVLVVKDGATTGKTAIIRNMPFEDAAINEHVFVLSFPFEKDTLNKFLFYFLISQEGNLQLTKKKKGIIGGIGYRDVKNTKMPFPPLGEQHRIVSKIEEIFSEIDAVISSLEKIKDQIKMFLRTTLNECFELGEEFKIKEVSEKIQYGMTSNSGINFEGPKYLRITDIQHGEVDWASVPNAKETENIDKYRLNEGDIVFARTGATVGKNFLIKNPPSNAIFASYLIRIVPDPDKIISKYLYYYFQSSRYWGDITRKKRGVGQPNVNGRILSNILLKVPALNVQDLIVKKLDNIFSIVKNVEIQIDENLDRYRVLRDAIFKQAFEGNLVPQDPNEESAKKLLERIKCETNE